MDIDKELELLTAKMKQLEQYAEELLEVRTGMLRHKERLNDAWVASEAEGINDLIDKMNRQIRWIADELQGIGHDMLKAYERLTEEGE